MAKTSPLSLYADTEEGQQRVQDYKDAQENLRKALSAREGQAFDPTLLAISQALASPTKTGSFGEVLGNVAGAIGTSQEAEQKRARENAAMRLELAQQGLQSYQATSADQQYRDIVKGITGGQPPSGGAAPAGTPAGAPAGAPTAVSAGAPATTGGVTAPTAAGAPAKLPAGRINVTPQQVLQLSDPRFDGRGKGIVEAAKFQREGIISTPQGPFNADTGQFLDVRLPNEEQKPVNTPYGKFDLFPYQVRKFYEQEELGQGREYLQSILQPKAARPVAGEPLPPDTAARELKREADVVTAKGKAEADVKRGEDFVNKSVAASARIPSLSSLEQFAQSPDAGKLLGVFEGSSLGQAIAKLAEPTLPQIREAFTQYGLPPEIKADQAFVLQQIALINAEMRKLLRAPGEGAQSDMENRAALAAGLDKADTPGGLLKKVRFLKSQAEFQRDLGRELAKSSMTPTNFLLSDKYDNLLQNYEKKLNSALGLSASPQRSPSRPASGNFGPAATRLREELGVR